MNIEGRLKKAESMVGVNWGFCECRNTPYTIAIVDFDRTKEQEVKDAQERKAACDTCGKDIEATVIWVTGEDPPQPTA